MSLPRFAWLSAQEEQQQPSSSSSSSWLSSYIPLRSDERSDDDEALFALSRWDRFLGFLLCCAGAAVCFLFSFLMLPRIPIQPRKFAMPFSMGSLLFLLGFAILQGPVAYLKHFFSRERLVFSMAYVFSLVFTIYFSVVARSYVGALVAALVQVITLVTYFVTYFPGGTTTLRYAGTMTLRGASSLLPV